MLIFNFQFYKTKKYNLPELAYSANEIETEIMILKSVIGYKIEVNFVSSTGYCMDRFLYLKTNLYKQKKRAFVGRLVFLLIAYLLHV